MNTTDILLRAVEALRYARIGFAVAYEAAEKRLNDKVLLSTGHHEVRARAAIAEAEAHLAAVREPRDSDLQDIVLARRQRLDTEQGKRAAMTDYSDLDDAIVNAIAAGKAPLYERDVNVAAKAIGNRYGETRAIDGRLTALKKAGRIRFVRGKDAHWELVP